MTRTTPVLDQDHFRFYEPGTETGSTAIAAEDTNISRTTGNPLQIRILVQESAGGNPGNMTWKLQYSKNSGSYTDVTASSSNVQAADDPDITDNAVTTSRLAGGTGSFTAGRFDDVDGALTSAINLNGSGNTEVLFSVSVVDADVANNDTLDFQIVQTDNTLLDNYNSVPRITVDKPAGGNAETLTATATGVATVAREVSAFRTLAATASGVAVLARLASLFRTLAATATGVAVLVRLKACFKTLAAIATGVATLAFVQGAAKALAATATGVATLARQASLNRTLAAVATGVATIAEKLGVSRALSATATGVAVLARKVSAFRALSATATGVATLVAATAEKATLAATAVGSAVLTRVAKYRRAIRAEDI